MTNRFLTRKEQKHFKELKKKHVFEKRLLNAIKTVTRPHCTLLYGQEPLKDKEEVKQVLLSHPGWIKLNLKEADFDYAYDKFLKQNPELKRILERMVDG